MAGMTDVQKLNEEVSQLMKRQFKINNRLQEKVGRLERRIVAIEHALGGRGMIAETGEGH